MTWLAAKYNAQRGPLDPLIDDLLKIFLAKPPEPNPARKGRSQADRPVLRRKLSAAFQDQK